MKTPREKFLSDPRYHNLVTMLESLIEQAEFTPSELREACVLASINYEMRHIRGMQIDPRVNSALMVLDEFVERGFRKK